MPKITRENLKKYRKLYYVKPKKRAGFLKSTLAVFMIWQLIVWQIVFSFNLRTATAADTGTENVTSSADSSPADSTHDSDSRKDDTEKKPDDGKNDATYGEKAKIDDKSSEIKHKKGKIGEDCQDKNSGTVADGKTDPNNSGIEKDDSASSAATTDSAYSPNGKTDSQSNDQSAAPVEEKSPNQEVQATNAPSDLKNSDSTNPDQNPKEIWKTCDLDNDLGKIHDEKERDRCKEKTTCGEIESCLQAIIKIENDADVSSDVETVADTGGNKVDVAEPLPSRDRMTDADQVQGNASETADITAAPAEQNVTADQSPVENAAAEDRSDRGDDANSRRQPNGDAATDDTQQTQENASAEIATGNAVAVSNVVNEVNTNIIGQNGMENVDNIYGDYNGDINLLNSFNSLLENGKDLNKENQSALGAMDISVENKADVNNDVATAADTGQNEIDNESDSGNSTIATGDAVAAADVVNIVNTNIIGNNFLFAVVNVFGSWTGDLIVPGTGLLTMPAADQADNTVVDVQNKATIDNDINTKAETGNNSVENQNGASSVQTGGAVADSTVVNQVGTTVVADNWFFLAINNMGNWVGNVLNWDEASGKYDNVFSFDFDEKDDPESEGLAGWIKKIFIKNDVKVENDIDTTASTGGNEIENKGGNASLKTGNASAFSKVYNLVNNNFIGNNWMFAVVNIFGSWEGNVNFVQPPQPVAASDSGQQPVASAGDQVKVLNPALNLSRSVSDKKINVGEISEHTLVLQNTGDSVIHNIVISDSVSNKKGGAGTYSWNVAKLDPGKKAIVKYKLLINSNAPSGKYENKASALGYDENDGEVRSNEAGTQIAVGTTDMTVASAPLDSSYYTYYTYYTYPQGVVPVESDMSLSQSAEAAEPDGKVLGESNALWNRPVDPNNFNPGWIVFPAALLLATHLRRKREKKVN